MSSSVSETLLNEMLQCDWRSPDVGFFFPSWAGALGGVPTAILLGTIARPFLRQADDGAFEIDSERAFTTLLLPQEIEEQALAVEFSIQMVRRGIDKLLSCGILEKVKPSPIEIVKQLQSKTPQIVLNSSRVCEWCNGTTYILQEHHHPIPKSEGGLETVKICPSCHYEYHHLEQRGFYRLTSAFLELGGAE